jgi:uncharacterized protein YbbC (DUF1343 family)
MIKPGAYQIKEYIGELKGKRVAVFANHTSMINNIHLVDTLRSLKVNINKIFAPEHGFRGTADAGTKIDNATDQKTGIAVISLYGKKLRPSDEDLNDVDVVIFDIQDVGVRFYTYISSLEELMVSVIRNNKPLIVLDRPNPNGFYIDGPVLKPAFKSFVGMQSVPVVYGMTIGEYAKMLCGENLFDSTTKAIKKRNNWNKLTVIKNAHYDHNSLYELPVKPSPNLPDNQSIYLYPTTCFFEGTVLSEGRGTDKPFKIFGHPSLPKNLYSFTPGSKEGASNPKLKGQQCYGWDLSDVKLKDLNKKIQLKYLIEAYRLFPEKDKFFLANKFFNKLAGNDVLMQQIRDGVSEESIRNSWQPDIDRFKKTRKKYLLYKDFE